MTEEPRFSRSEPGHDESASMPTGGPGNADELGQALDVSAGQSVGHGRARVIWGQGTHFAGIVERVNPGHFGQGPTRSDEAEDH